MKKYKEYTTNPLRGFSHTLWISLGEMYQFKPKLERWWEQSLYKSQTVSIGNTILRRGNICQK